MGCQQRSSLWSQKQRTNFCVRSIIDCLRAHSRRIPIRHCHQILQQRYFPIHQDLPCAAKHNLDNSSTGLDSSTDLRAADNHRFEQVGLGKDRAALDVEGTSRRRHEPRNAAMGACENRGMVEIFQHRRADDAGRKMLFSRCNGPAVPPANPSMANVTLS